MTTTRARQYELAGETTVEALKASGTSPPSGATTSAPGTPTDPRDQTAPATEPLGDARAVGLIIGERTALWGGNSSVKDQDRAVSAVNGRRSPLDAQMALLALRAIGLSYRPDTSVPDGAWIATCPACRRPNALKITEARPGGAVSVGCRRRCRPPQEIAMLLSTDPEVLAARAEAARWRSLACWAIESYRRSIASSMADQAADPVLAVAA
jgi:hypothetical protein